MGPDEAVVEAVAGDALQMRVRRTGDGKGVPPVVPKFAKARGKLGACV